ncbi:endolytic transglycosylase MltG [Paenibacillus thalictri]|uniref:Endolytic murein transglycosylase n=1 Tax=Paenibacillus thalictri TaxID=2527873 RepID=A0A4Q9DXJ8_9BACL|nr:endolytic transglycosylase MltG [Paenibacillus thalictri]TBL81857.1 endolytic transglycosylase MltG [Paenibacillus thalictri]
MHYRASRRANRIWIAALAAMAVAGFLIGIGLYLANALKPMPEGGANVQFEILPGTGSAGIAKQLEKQGIIRNAAVFTYYLKYVGEGAKFQAGKYEMASGITAAQIIDKLNKGQTVKEETFRLTVPEGFTLQQIADKVSAQTGIEAKTIMQAADQPDAYAAKSLQGIPNNPGIKHRLEGYLFPDTYEWKKDASVQEMIDRMTGELDSKLEQLPPDWPQVMKAKDLDFHQLLTVASLIEKEVVLDEERPLVASVIYNRLGKKMNLQIDATIQYMLDKPKERLLEKDLQLESPYNTYLHAGLPPGPIASPSLNSIRAALYPDNTPFLFYVTKKDGSKGHLFAKTFDEHLKNNAASKK